MSEEEKDRQRRKVDEQQEIFNLATQRWLDEKFRDFGKWTFNALAAVAFILLLRLIFAIHINDLRSFLQIGSEVNEMTK
jgi:hypothetical protein